MFRDQCVGITIPNTIRKFFAITRVGELENEINLKIEDKV